MPGMDVDLRRVRFFVEVAERLSFVRAAQALHLTQPALSRQIAALEDDWGVRLFTRSRRGTELTSEGTALLERARTLLRHAADFERHARVVGRAPARFVIGFMPGIDAAGLIDAFRRRQPGVDVSAIYTSMISQARFLTDGRADVVFVRPPVDVDGVTVTPLFDEPMVAAVRRDDLLAERRSLRVAELEASDVRLIGRAASGDSGDAGRDEVVEPEAALLAVATGSAVAVLPAGIAAFYSDPSIAYIPVVDAPPQQVALAYDARRALPAIDDFVAICREELAQRITELPGRLLGEQRAPARPSSL